VSRRSDDGLCPVQGRQKSESPADGLGFLLP